MNLAEPIISVQRDKFLFDYKILIFMLIVLIISIILAIKKKSWRKAMLSLCASDVIIAISYRYNRIYETSRYGYTYFLETNDSFDDLGVYTFGMIVLFFIIFLGEKVIDRIKGGK